MKTERIGNTIDLILLILFSVSSVFLCIQINLGKYLNVFAQIIFILFLILVLLSFFTLTLKSKKYFYLRKVILVCLSGCMLYTSFQMNQKKHQNEEVIQTYYRLNLVTNHKEIQLSTDFNESKIGTLVSDRNHIQNLDDLDKAFNMKDSEVKEFYNMTNLIQALNKNEIQGAILSDHNLAILNERFQNMKLNIISESGIYVEISHKSKNDDITKPFTVLVSINDNHVPLNYVSASNQCLILFVDPIDKKITSVEIPNNLYIPNVAYDSYPDALYNVSYNGIDNLLYSLESIFGFEFDYFMKTSSKAIFNSVDIMQGITITSKICENNVCEYIEEEYDAYSIKDYYQHTKDVQSILKGIFDKRIHLMAGKLIDFTNNYVENAFTNFSSTKLNDFITLFNKDDEWTFDQKHIDEILYSNEPCISYGVHDEHSVAIIHDESIHEIYSYYEDLKHLDKMNQFEFDLSYMNNSHLIPKVNPKLITVANMDWKINEYFAFLPQSVVQPIEVEKWQGTINFEKPNFNPDGPIYPID